ncbi:hypothetical protein JYT83_01210 [bacterium AH-315-F18]|nr:hypothetical protein [bacterium AH-315-F18]
MEALTMLPGDFIQHMRFLKLKTRRATRYGAVNIYRGKNHNTIVPHDPNNRTDGVRIHLWHSSDSIYQQLEVLPVEGRPVDLTAIANHIATGFSYPDTPDNTLKSHTYSVHKAFKNNDLLVSKRDPNLISEDE